MTDDIKRYQANLRDELDGATLYRALAAAEPDPIREDLFLQLAQAEAQHAGIWREKLRRAGVRERPYVPGFRTRLLGRLAHFFGPGFVMPTIAAGTFFLLFSLGAFVPIAPFFWMRGSWAISTSICASAAALCAVGMLTSLFNGRSPWFSAARQALFGCAAAGLTYGIGTALGVSLS